MVTVNDVARGESSNVKTISPVCDSYKKKNIRLGLTVWYRRQTGAKWGISFPPHALLLSKDTCGPTRGFLSITSPRYAGLADKPVTNESGSPPRALTLSKDAYGPIRGFCRRRPWRLRDPLTDSPAALAVPSGALCAPAIISAVERCPLRAREPEKSPTIN